MNTLTYINNQVIQSFLFSSFYKIIWNRKCDIDFIVLKKVVKKVPLMIYLIEGDGSSRLFPMHIILFMQYKKSDIALLQLTGSANFRIFYR